MTETSPHDHDHDHDHDEVEYLDPPSSIPDIEAPDD